MESNKSRIWSPEEWVSLDGVKYLLALVGIFLMSASFGSLVPSLVFLQAVSGLLLLFVPGVLITNALEVGTRSLTDFALFSAGFGLAFLSVLSVVVSIVGPAFGVDAPLSLTPLFLVLVAASGLLLARTDSLLVQFDDFGIDTSGSIPVLVLVFLLPTLAAVTAIALNGYGTNLPMHVFFLAIVLVTLLLVSTEFVPTSQFGTVLFFVSLSVLLHRNLIAAGVVGADIQFIYFLAQFLFDSQLWDPAVGGSILSLPVVTSVPAVIATVTGMEVAWVFKTVYVLLFSLVPVGVYRLGREIFGEYEALFGSLFFLFYHGSFYFTPGKQLISELFFVLLLLLVFRRDLGGVRGKAAAFLLAIGLVHSHYGTTYVFGISLLFASVVLAVFGRFVDDVDYDLSPIYPAVLLAMATGWYAYASDELIARLASVPLSIASQLASILSSTPTGSGAGYAQTQTTALEIFNLFLYILLTVLLTIGVTWTVANQLVRIKRGQRTEHLGYVALAVPLFVFLASSFFVTANLWADRAYQMVLVVLAPFAPVGYRVLTHAFAEVRSRSGIGTVRVNQWALLAVLIALLLAFNSGLAFALSGTAETSSFNPNANDLAFSQSEYDGAAWIGTHGNVAFARGNSPAPQSEENVFVYTDMRSSHVFRSTLPSSYTNAEVVLLKTNEQPQLRQEFDDGYVYVRQRSVSTDTDSGQVPPSRLSAAEVASIEFQRDVVYSNGAVRIVELDDEASTERASTNGDRSGSN